MNKKEKQSINPLGWKDYFGLIDKTKSDRKVAKK